MSEGYWTRFRRSRYTRTSIGALQLGCAVHLVTTTAFIVSWNYGVSMYPTFAEKGDAVLIRRCSRSNPLSMITRGDIVEARSLAVQGRPICKRVLGLPGDTIWVDPTGESGIPASEWIKVPSGYVWLVGDNPSGSRDSREYGPVPINLVRGKVVAQLRPRLRWWPKEVEIQPVSPHQPE